MNTKMLKIKMAIATGLLATFVVLPVSAASPDLIPVETSGAMTKGMVIDETQENGGYGASEVTMTKAFLIDEAQENGGYGASEVTMPKAFLIDEGQENGG